MEWCIFDYGFHRGTTRPGIVSLHNLQSHTVFVALELKLCLFVARKQNWTPGNKRFSIIIELGWWGWCSLTGISGLPGPWLFESVSENALPRTVQWKTIIKHTSRGESKKNYKTVSSCIDDFSSHQSKVKLLRCTDLLSFGSRCSVSALQILGLKRRQKS